MTLQPLSGLDAGFLALETRTAPMLVGGVSILGPLPGGRPLSVEEIRRTLRPRLARAVGLRRKLAALPLSLTRPYWVELAPEAIDLERLVEATELPEPGGWRELSALFAWELAQAVPRDEPLWRLVLATGLQLPEHPPGSVALIGKVHHAAIDGVSGAEILSALFDLAGTPTEAAGGSADGGQTGGAAVGGTRLAQGAGPAASAADAPDAAVAKRGASVPAAANGAADPPAKRAADQAGDQTASEDANDPSQEPALTPSEPSVLELAARAGRDLAALPLELGAVAGRSLLGLAAGTWLRAKGEVESRLRRGFALPSDLPEPAEGGGSAPPLPFTAPPSPLNRPLSGRYVWSHARLDLRRVRAIKNAVGATVNDVVLATCAGALRDWLRDQRALPEAPLVAMVPVSVRAEHERHAAGNLVSAMLVSLATDRADPSDRLRAIRDAARSSKVAHQAVGARTLMESTELLPFALSGLAVRLYSRHQLAERHRPIFNLVITNVPGPPRPLELAGAPLREHIGSAPLFDGLGLILTVLSYAGAMTVGVTADHTVLRDARVLAERLEAELGSLAEAAGV
jgi:WS/DGAT/MGAT family acyltransferase